MMPALDIITAQIPKDKMFNRLSVNAAKTVQWHNVTLTTKLGVESATF